MNAYFHLRTFQVIICLYASSEFIILWFHTTRFSWVRLMQAGFTPTDGTRTAGIVGQGTRYDNISSINNAKCPVSPQRLLPVVTGRLAAKFHWSSGRLLKPIKHLIVILSPVDMCEMYFSVNLVIA